MPACWETAEGLVVFCDCTFVHAAARAVGEAE